MKKISIIGKNNSSIEKIIDDAHLFLEDTFKIGLKNPITVTLCLTRKDFEKKLGRKTQEWEVGNASTNNIDILHPNSFEKYSTHKKDEFPSILKHELAHIFIEQLSEGKVIPMWPEEGLANCLADNTNAYFNNQPIYAETDFLEKLSTSFGWDQHSNYCGYSYSCLFVNFLIKKFSMAKILELIYKSKKMFSIVTFESTFKEVFGDALQNEEHLFVEEYTSR